MTGREGLPLIWLIMEEWGFHDSHLNQFLCLQRCKYCKAWFVFNLSRKKNASYILDCTIYWNLSQGGGSTKFRKTTCIASRKLPKQIIQDSASHRCSIIISHQQCQRLVSWILGRDNGLSRIICIADNLEDFQEGRSPKATQICQYDSCATRLQPWYPNVESSTEPWTEFDQAVGFKNLTIEFNRWSKAAHQYDQYPTTDRTAEFWDLAGKRNDCSLGALYTLC